MPRDGEPVVELLREWVLFQRRRGLTLADATAVAVRDGHLMALRLAEDAERRQFRFARFADDAGADRTLCLPPGGPSVAFVNTCDELLWVRVCPIAAVTAVVNASQDDLEAFCRIRSSATQPDPVVTRFTLPSLERVSDFGAMLRGTLQVVPFGDTSDYVVAACGARADRADPSSDVVPVFVGAPQGATGEFVFACRRVAR